MGRYGSNFNNYLVGRIDRCAHQNCGYIFVEMKGKNQQSWENPCAPVYTTHFAMPFFMARKKGIRDCYKAKVYKLSFDRKQEGLNYKISETRRVCSGLESFGNCI